MAKVRQGNKVILRTLDKTDNTITEGYISSEQLLTEMKRAGQTTVNYIESAKNNMTEENKQALKEQIKSEQFRAQLKKAVYDSKDKIDTIYNKNRLSKKINEATKEMQNAHKKYIESYEKYEKESLKAEIKYLKKEKENLKKE